MEIIGNFVSQNTYNTKMIIELPPADLKAQLKPTRELKVGNTVWTEGKVAEIYNNTKEIKINHQGREYLVLLEDIIAVFSSEPEEKVKAEVSANDCRTEAQIADVFNRIFRIFRTLEEMKGNK